MTTTTVNPIEQQAPDSDLPDTPPMANPEAKAAWLAALRSGQYRQARGALYDPRIDAYCCLGVACEVYRLTTGEGRWTSVAGFFRASEDDEQAYSGTLPPAVREWYGLPESDPVVAGLHLTELNDTEGASFEQLAQLIEANL